MARRISLSRAARLVGVRRGVLQQQIRDGRLQTFEGEIVLSDLLQAYPNAHIEDSSMLERVEQIIEQASFVSAERISRKADNPALAARVMALGKDLSRQQRRVAGYRRLLEMLTQDPTAWEKTDFHNLIDAKPGQYRRAAATREVTAETTV